MSLKKKKTERKKQQIAQIIYLTNVTISLK